MAESQTAEKTEAPAEAKSGSSLISKLLIVGFMLGVVGVEVAIAMLLIPDAEEVAAITAKRMEEQLPNFNNDEVLTEDEANPTVEVELGEYTVTVSQPNSSTALRVDFTLVGTVLEEDEAELTKLFDRHVHRFRDQVLFEIRNSQPADLSDPGLGLIKRRILEKSTTLFGKPLLKSVVFPQFSYVEQ